ncbi:cytochrome P450 [Nocardiopsis sp. RSe5-2]|uniref:Cytochrome P450 n=1 Tax=Nocardiopsis endophytica TaxID=3018445 RepID=A0ABT4U393_9ACTN|nr:cytochrome P450 [Nocardiopsis endophytica]MDA2811427.1 cytochrome P450 [Nocardiopsis endophytica]
MAGPTLHDTGRPALELPLPRRCPMSEPAEYADLRTGGPTRVRTRDGRWVWAVTRYADVRALLSSPDFSADGRNPDLPAVKPEMRGVLTDPPFLRQDPPRHTAERRLLIPEFTLRRVQGLRPGVERTTAELLDGMRRKGPPADLVEDLALPLPSSVICRLLGVPYDDHAFFQEQARAVVSRTSTREETLTALGRLFGYMDELLTRKRRDPGDDVMSRLATRHMEPAGELSREGAVKMCAMVLTAGHETTANMIALGAVALAEDPDLRAVVRERPDRVPDVVAELLRYFSIADLIPVRVAVRDTRVGGVDIRAGEGAIALLAGANRDPEAFGDPDRLRVRSGDQRHLAFGYGVHQCLGANLARMELEVVLPALVERLPGLRLEAPVSELPYKHDGLVFGLHSLPVSWGGDQ